MNIYKITLFLFLSNAFVAFSQTTESLDKLYDEAYQNWSKVKSPEELAKFKKIFEDVRKENKALSALSPEEQKKRLIEAEAIATKLLEMSRKDLNK